MFLKDILLKIKDYLFPGIFLILIFGSFAQAQTISNLNINDVNRPEGNAGTTSFQFTISLSQINDQDVTVQVDSLDGSATSAGNDYTPITAQIITIPANTVSQTVTVNVTGDTQFEPDETFFVLLSSPSPNAVLDDGQGQGTIVNDDALPAVTLSLTGSPMAEAGGSATVTADLSFITGDAVTVDLDFSGTASNATDYNASGNQIVIPAGSASGTITLTAVEDDLDEIDETVIVSISNVVNAIEAGQQAVVATIADNDSPPEITLSLSGSPLAEAGAAATVTAMLAAASTLPVTVDLGFSGTAVNTSNRVQAVHPARRDTRGLQAPTTLASLRQHRSRPVR
jgi:hypothetical protein